MWELQQTKKQFMIHSLPGGGSKIDVGKIEVTYMAELSSVWNYYVRLHFIFMVLATGFDRDREKWHMHK